MSPRSGLGLEAGRFGDLWESRQPPSTSLWPQTPASSPLSPKPCLVPGWGSLGAQTVRSPVVAGSSPCHKYLAACTTAGQAGQPGVPSSCEELWICSLCPAGALHLWEMGQRVLLGASWKPPGLAPPAPASNNGTVSLLDFRDPGEGKSVLALGVLSICAALP